MARVTREVVVCDVCGGEDDVAAVTIAADGEERRAELCAGHRQQLQEAVAGVLSASAAEGSETPTRGRKAVAGTTRAARRTIPIDQTRLVGISRTPHAQDDLPTLRAGTGRAEPQPAHRRQASGSSGLMRRISVRADRCGAGS